MQQIQGFVTKSSFISNLPKVVAEFFELSPFSLTYSRAQGEYQHPSHQGTVLHTFKSVDLDTLSTVVLTPDQVNEIMSVVDTVLSYTYSHSFPFNVADFRATVSASYSGVITDFITSDFYSGADVTLPEWLSWNSVAGNGASVKIWLRNESFENQYSDYEIIPVGPVPALDDFFGNYGSMVTRLNTLGPLNIMDRHQEAKAGFPESVTRIYSFGYVNPNNATQINKVYWGVLIYGRNGDNIDAVKEALANFILSHTTHTQADWEQIFPDIFRRTEFLFLPRWDKIAIPNLTELAGLYSSVCNPYETYSFATKQWYNVSSDRLTNDLTVWPFDYKAISLIALNGETNALGYEKLDGLYPDYIPVGTNSLDFNRMNIQTREWATMMVELIRAAETATDASSIENPMRKVTRDGLLYVARTVGDVNYMVSARSNPVFTGRVES